MPSARWHGLPRCRLSPASSSGRTRPTKASACPWPTLITSREVGCIPGWKVFSSRPTGRHAYGRPPISRSPRSAQHPVRIPIAGSAAPLPLAGRRLASLSSEFLPSTEEVRSCDVQISARPGRGRATDSDRGQRPAMGIARGAALIAGLTMLSRLLGLIRTLVFSQAVGANCLGAAYVTANQVPNLIYELVLGGALTSAMVPILARSAERSDDDPQAAARVSQLTSALLT